MVEPGYLLSALAALFFLVIGLEELPLRFNVLRVHRSVRRTARRRGEPPLKVLDRLVISTHRSVLVLVGFALASALLLWFVRDTTPQGMRLAPPIQVFAATCVLGLLFLAFAFQAWGPRLMALVAHEIKAETAGSNGRGPFAAEKTKNGHDP